MKKTLILTGIGFIAAFLLLYVFNKVTSKNNTSELYTEVQNGEFVISVTVVGQLIAENSIDIKGPAFGQRRNIRSRHIKIQDLIPEGTIVNKGDYVAELDRTELENTLKDQREVLKTLQSNIEMKKLDTRVVAILPDLSSMISKTFVSETDLSKIKTGLNVNITVNAFPKKGFKGTVLSIANIGEKLQNTFDKVFEVQIKTGGSDPLLRPSMTTINKIIVKTIDDAVYVPVECVHTSVDSISYVYTKNGDKQIVLLGDSNGKNIVIEKGLISGTIVYLNNPESTEKFNLIGEDLIPLIKERYKEISAENSSYMN